MDTNKFPRRIALCEQKPLCVPRYKDSTNHFNGANVCGQSEREPVWGTRILHQNLHLLMLLLDVLEHKRSKNSLYARTTLQTMIAKIQSH